MNPAHVAERNPGRGSRITLRAIRLRIKLVERRPVTEKIALNVNGKTHAIEAGPDMPLLYALRNDLGLNNPRFGCGLAQCGACTVHLDGQPIRSCITTVSMVGSAQVVTLAGLGTPEKPHPLQTAYIDEQVPQCGYASTAGS
jgi:nicotinate dehydrogenase subunit A